MKPPMPQTFAQDVPGWDFYSLNRNPYPCPYHNALYVVHPVRRPSLHFLRVNLLRTNCPISLARLPLSQYFTVLPPLVIREAWSQMTTMLLRLKSFSRNKTQILLMTATRVLEAQNGRNYGLDHSFCLSSYKDCTPLSPSFRIIMLSRRTIIIQSFLSGGMLKAIDFPL